MYNLTKDQTKKYVDLCKTFEMNYYEYNWLNVCWSILNKICEKHIESPIEMVEQIKLFGVVCFNNNELNHPIDYLYDLYMSMLIEMVVKK